jgi:hypothetical protein
LTEALNDGVTVGWDGNTYPNYGTLTRTASQFTGTRLVPTAPTQVTGSITLAQMETAYQATNFGSGKYEINVIATTAKGFGYVRQNYQTQQRFQNVTVAKIGFRGLEYNGAVIMASRYAPGSYLTANSGTNDRVATRMFSYATGGAVTSYPAGSLGTGETMWFLNVRKPFIKYRTSKSRPYNGSLDDDGFIPSAGNTRLVGKVLLAQNFTVLPGYHTYLWGFTG